MKKLFTIFCLLITWVSLSQEKLNQLDLNKRRTGKWLIYLDKDWKRTDDSSNAQYCRYTWYHDGMNIYPMGPCGKEGYKLESPANSGSSKLLNGEYKWLDEKGKLSSVHVFKNGVYISCKEYFPGGKDVEQYFDFTEKCQGSKHGWKVTIYKKNGDVKMISPTCPDASGKWPLMRD